MVRLVIPIILVLLLVPPDHGTAQIRDSTRDTSGTDYEDAWTSIVTRDGVEFDYLFYRQADNQNNGVVIRLRNGNDVPIRYAFTIIFRGPRGQTTAQATGRLKPGEMKTGEPDGLFWIPFKNGRRVAEVGLRGIEITRENEDASVFVPRG